MIQISTKEYDMKFGYIHYKIVCVGPGRGVPKMIRTADDAPDSRQFSIRHYAQLFKVCVCVCVCVCERTAGANEY